MARENVLWDMGFESNPSTWSPHDGASIIGDSSQARSGSRCLRLTVDTPFGTPFADRSVPLTAGGSYQLSYYGKRNNELAVDPMIQYQDSANNWKSITGPRGYYPSAYTKEIWSFTLPVGSKNFWLSFRGQGSTQQGIANVWIDDCSVVRTDVAPSVPSTSGTNRLLNGDFETNAAWAITSPGGFSTSNAYSGSRCLHLTTDPSGGLVYASQFVRVRKGSTYTLRFRAKRTGYINLNINVMYKNSNGGNSFLDAPVLHEFIENTYTQLGCTFTIPATASSNEISLLLGVLGTTNENVSLWFDDVELWGEAPDSDAPRRFTVGAYGRTSKSGVRFFPEAERGDINTGPLPNSSVFIIADEVTGQSINGDSLWVKVFYGTANGTTEYRYVHAGDFEEYFEAQDETYLRVTNLALGLIGMSGPNLGLGGDWCQTFIYWLCGASGQPLTNMPYPTLNSEYKKCGPARKWFEEREQYTQLNGQRPLLGDLVYYRGENEDENSHVGIIYEAYNGTYYAVEGNIGDPGDPYVGLVSGSYITGECYDHSRIVHGFAHPDWGW